MKRFAEQTPIERLESMNRFLNTENVGLYRRNGTLDYQAMLARIEINFLINGGAQPPSPEDPA